MAGNHVRYSNVSALTSGPLTFGGPDSPAPSTVMQFLHWETAILAVYVSEIGQYYLLDANAVPIRKHALAVRRRLKVSFTNRKNRNMTKSALRFLKKQRTRKYRRYRKELSLLDS